MWRHVVVYGFTDVLVERIVYFQNQSISQGSKLARKLRLQVSCLLIDPADENTVPSSNTLVNFYYQATWSHVEDGILQTFIQ